MKLRAAECRLAYYTTVGAKKQEPLQKKCKWRAALAKFDEISRSLHENKTKRKQKLQKLVLKLEKYENKLEFGKTHRKRSAKRCGFDPRRLPTLVYLFWVAWT